MCYLSSPEFRFRFRMTDEGEDPAHEEPEDEDASHHGDADEPNPQEAHDQTKGNTGETIFSLRLFILTSCMMSQGLRTTLPNKGRKRLFSENKQKLSYV